jgi:hypothetical protein
VIETYKELVYQHMFTWLADKLGLDQLFLQLKGKWRPFDETWFMISPISCNWLHLLVDNLIADFHDLHKKILCNKTD